MERETLTFVYKSRIEKFSNVNKFLIVERRMGPKGNETMKIEACELKGGHSWRGE